MTAAEMHLQFNTKFNSLASSQNRVWTVQEVDILLNLAQLHYIKLHIPRFSPSKLSRRISAELISRGLGSYSFETTQRDIDSIRTIVVNNESLSMVSSSDEEYVFGIPDNYLYFLSGRAIMSGPCGERKGALIVRSHDDGHESSPFDRSDYMWGEVNIRFMEDGIKCFANQSFVITGCEINYIRMPRPIYYGTGFQRVDPTTGSIITGYEQPDGTLINFDQDSELPELSHDEIVDIAVGIGAAYISKLDVKNLFYLLNVKS